MVVMEWVGWVWAEGKIKKTSAKVRNGWMGPLNMRCEWLQLDGWLSSFPKSDYPDRLCTVQWGGMFVVEGRGTQ